MQTDRSTTQPITFQQLWESAVLAHGDNTFLRFSGAGENASWTYSDFDDLVTGTAQFLGAQGVERGHSIHLALKNCPAFLMLWLAASRLGAWIVPVDPASTARDIASQLRRTTPTIGFYAEDRRDVYLEGSSSGLARAIALSEGIADASPGSVLLGSGALTESTAMPADRLAVMFTSGTTSAPKGVVLTQENYLHVSRTMASIIGQLPEDRWFVTLPLFHANAQFYCFGPAIAAGSSVALTSTFSASRWLHQAAELEVTHASLFAAPIRMILSRRPDDAPRLALKHVWFAQSLGESHYREFSELIGCPPRQLYGMTETTAVVTADMTPSPRHDVIGTPALGRKIALVNPLSGAPAHVGEPVVIMVQGTPGIDLFEAYLDDPATTAKSFSVRGNETWFRTGDLARADTDGVLHFVGRIDDVIKVAGENVSLTEVEAALSQAPGVLEVAVLAKSDPIRDHVPVAFIVARDPSDPPSIEDLMLWAEQNLAPQSRPRSFAIIHELPRTSVGKIRRFQLQAAANDSQVPE